MGFAIPVDYAFGIAEQLIQGKTPSHAQLGVSLITVNNELAQRFGIQATEGAYINSLTAGGAAAKAGLQEGDVILKVDGESITSSSDLVLAIRSHSPNDEVDVTYLRDGKWQGRNDESKTWCRYAIVLALSLSLEQRVVQAHLLINPLRGHSRL